MKIILIVLLCSAFCSIYIFRNIKPKPKQHKRIDRNNKYKMPVAFWDDYNWLSLKIYNMYIDECDNVQTRIDQFFYKYEQYMDTQVFNDRASILLNDYKKRINYLLNNKN